MSTTTCLGFFLKFQQNIHLHCIISVLLTQLCPFHIRSLYLQGFNSDDEARELFYLNYQPVP